MSTDLNPQLSVIIPVSDDPGIVDCVQSLIPSDELRVEVIVVLNGATKVFTESVKKKLESYNYVRIIEMTEPSIPGARNLGVRNALAAKILMFDSDCRPESQGYLSSVAKSLDHSQIIVGVVRFKSLTESRISKGYAALRQLDYDLHQLNRLYTPNLAYQSTVFDTVGPYLESLVTGEDAEWGSRVLTAGYQVRRIDATVIHFQNASLGRAVRTWFLYGRAKGVQIRGKHSGWISPIHDLAYVIAPLGSYISKAGGSLTTLWLRISLSCAFQTGFLTGLLSRMEDNL